MFAALEAIAVRRAAALALGLVSSMLVAAPANRLPPARTPPNHFFTIWGVPTVPAPPRVDIPQGWRRRNWSPYGFGSCAHASMTMLLHWQGKHELAEWWERNHSGGTDWDRLSQSFDLAHVRFAETRTGDVAFLEWAIRTRRGCGVTVQGGDHMVLLVHLDDRVAGRLDNNNPGPVTYQRRDDFLAEWKAASGWAVTPVYEPAPPTPFHAM